MNAIRTPLKYLASLKLTVVCHIFFIILVVWGTLYQADGGLFAAKKRFFTSWIFFIEGIVPFPGGATIMTVFFLNLVAVFIVRFKWRWRNAGLLLTHVGLLILCGGSGWIYYATNESYLTLVEGESAAYSEDNVEWMLALWPVDENQRKVSAISTLGLEPEDVLNFHRHKCSVKVESYYDHSKAFGGPPDESAAINSQGVRRLEPQPRKEEQAFPGGIFLFSNTQGRARVLLYAGVSGSTTFGLGDTTWQAILQPRRHKLPATFELIDVSRSLYEGTTIPKSFESHLTIVLPEGNSREARISMNNPLQFQGFTFFQSGYNQIGGGKEATTLAIVENPGRLIPYISCFIISLGILVHFIMQMIRQRER